MSNEGWILAASPGWSEKDAEADDVIATLAAAVAPRRVVIMSRDRGFYQLVTDRVIVLNPFRAGRKLVTPAEVYARHQVNPRPMGGFPGTGR